MDLRGYPQVSVNNNLVFALDNMVLSEIKSRNYSVKSKVQKLFSTNPITEKFVDNIKNYNNIGLDMLLSTHGHVVDENNLCPLKIAILCNNIHAMKIILDYLNWTLDDTSMLAFACEHNHELAKELLKCKNVDVNKKGGSANEMPLFYAMNSESMMQLVSLLLSFDTIDLNSELFNGKTLLQYAILNNKKNIVPLLLNHKSLKLDKSDIDLIFRDGTSEIISCLLNSNKLDNSKKYLNDYFIKLVKRDDISIEILASFDEFIDINYRDLFGKTALMYIAEIGNNFKLSYILNKYDVNLSVVDDYGMNALMFAVSNKTYLCAKLLVDYIMEKCNNKEVILNQHNELGETSLLIAAKNSTTELFKLIFNTHLSNINYPDIYGYCPLYYSIESHNMEIFDLLLNDDSLDINLRDFEGNTQLMHSVNKSIDEYTYKLLLSDKLDINLVNNNGHNILGYILQQKYSSKMETKSSFGDGESFTTGAPFPQCLTNDICDNYSLNSGFFGSRISTSSDDKQTKINKLINYLVKKGIDMNVFDIYNKLPLMYVIDNKDKEVFNFFINSNTFDVNVNNNCGQTYLMYLFEKLTENKKHGTELSKQFPTYFVNDDIDFSITNNLPKTNSKQMMNNMNTTQSTQINVDNIYLTFFMQLLNHPNVNINATNQIDDTLLFISASSNNVSIFNKILSHANINVNAQNYQGLTPLMSAASNGLWNNVRLLLNNGANDTITDMYGKCVKDYLDDKGLFIYNRLIESLNNKNDNNVNVKENTKRWFF